MAWPNIDNSAIRLFVQGWGFCRLFAYYSINVFSISIVVILTNYDRVEIQTVEYKILVGLEDVRDLQDIFYLII